MPSYKNAQRNTWYCAFYFTDWQGKRKKKKKEGFKTKREAQEWERKFLEQFAGTPDISFDILLAEYKKKQQTKNDQRTYFTECNMIKNHIEPCFTGITIDKITKQYVLSWKDNLAKKNYSAAYSKRIYNILKYILDFAVVNKPSYIMAFYILFWTGMRCGEMLGLKWSDIDFKANAISIDKSYYRLHKKIIIRMVKQTQVNV